MCKIMDDLNKKAVYENKKQTALTMINKGKYTFEEISECTGLSLSEVKDLAEAEKVSKN